MFIKQKMSVNKVATKKKSLNAQSLGDHEKVGLLNYLGRERIEMRSKFYVEIVK